MTDAGIGQHDYDTIPPSRDTTLDTTLDTTMTSPLTSGDEPSRRLTDTTTAEAMVVEALASLLRQQPPVMAAAVVPATRVALPAETRTTAATLLPATTTTILAAVLPTTASAAVLPTRLCATVTPAQGVVASSATTTLPVPPPPAPSTTSTTTAAAGTRCDTTSPSPTTSHKVTPAEVASVSSKETTAATAVLAAVADAAPSTTTPTVAALPPRAPPEVPDASVAQKRQRLTAASFPRPCLAHRPTLSQVQRQTFSAYVQDVVLRSAVPLEEDYANDESDYSSSEDDRRDERNWQTTCMPLAEGIAKVSLPLGFWATEQASWTAGDRTGRGPAWAVGTPLGDYPMGAPIAQHVRGLAGIYEFSFMDQTPLTLAEFRTKADAYRAQHVGCAHDVFEEATAEGTAAAEAAAASVKKEEETNNGKASQDKKTSKPKHVFADEAERLTYLERYFWKRLGPTMPPAWYAADHEGTLFPEDDDASGWSLGQLDSCLHVLPKVPGVTSPYLYAGMWASVFCAHSEDMNLLSINYLHAGAPKLWYAIAPGADAQRFDSLCASSFAGTPSTKGCKEFLRHKRSLLSPKILQKAGIRYTTAIQRPGDAIITFPSGYHFGFNAGFNMAEATNFAVPEWIPYGWKARVCLCRPDSVRVDMHRLTSLLEEYEADQGCRRKRLPWKEWAVRRHKRQLVVSTATATKSAPSPAKKKKKKAPLSDQQRKREFWIEVVKPVARSRRQPAAAATPKKQAASEEPEEAGRGKRKRKLTAKAAKWEREQQRKAAAAVAPEEPKVVVEEIWHLAKPLPRKIGGPGTRVLCLLPGTMMGYAAKNPQRGAGKVPNKRRSGDLDDSDEEEGKSGTRSRKHVTDDEEEMDEQCFKGAVVEISDGHARIHIDGLPRSEDVWLNLFGNKVYLDGGRWDDEEEDSEAPEEEDTGRSLPQRHYWKVMDSKRRCS